MVLEDFGPTYLGQDVFDDPVQLASVSRVVESLDTFVRSQDSIIVMFLRQC